MANYEIIHANHVGAAVATVGSEVVITANTVSVFYDAGWPATRPAATTVLCFGHTSGPSWLTSVDVWFEAV